VPLKNAIGTDNFVELHRLQCGLRGYPRWGANQEEYSYPTPENPYQNAHNSVLHHLEEKLNGGRKFGGYVVQQVEGIARVSADTVYM